MLDRHEEEALAEIEARLHEQDPDLAEALEAGKVVIHLHPLVIAALVLLVAVVLSTLTTLWLGPNIGALVAVLGLSYAFLYGWQALLVGRGLRQRE